MRTVRLLVVLLSLVATSVVAGCGGSDKATTSPRQTLAAAKRNLDRTSGVRIGLSTPRLPDGVSGLLSAQGVGTHAPAFAGTIRVAASGITADASVVAVDGKVHAKLPFSLKFVTIDPADYGAPDPAQLMSSRGGLSSLLTTAEHVKQGKQVRQGKMVLRSYTGTVPGRAVAAVLPSASAKAHFDATFTVTDQKRLTKAVLTGPFYPEAGDVTYTVTFDDYGIRKSITAP
jgi:lipoprotein LprG